MPSVERAGGKVSFNPNLARASPGLNTVVTVNKEHSMLLSGAAEHLLSARLFGPRKCWWRI